MPQHSIGLPMSRWPTEIRARFTALELSAYENHRLGVALGRWMLICHDLGVDPGHVTQNLWLARCEGLGTSARNDMRRALSCVFPDKAQELYLSTETRAARKDPRGLLEARIDSNLARFPENWQRAAGPLLRIDPDNIEDGILLQAWEDSTIVRRVQACARHFDFCRISGLPVDITAASVRAELAAYQKRCGPGGDRRIGGASAHIMSLTCMAGAVFPERNWGWLKTTRDRLKKIAEHHPSRNASRAVDAAELRAAGQALLDEADTEQQVALNRRQMIKAHTRARTALCMIFLSEAPLRIEGVARLELSEQFFESLAGVLLSASDTKEKQEDRRAFSRTLIDALTRYITRHRARVVRAGETRLFVGDYGAPIVGATLTSCLGAMTEITFGKRVTAHSVRHSVANYIIATAPDEAALASEILNNRNERTTEIYREQAQQIVASRRLNAATRSGAAEVGADTEVFPKARGKRRPHSVKRRLPRKRVLSRSEKPRSATE